MLLFVRESVSKLCFNLLFSVADFEFNLKVDTLGE